MDETEKRLRRREFMRTAGTPILSGLPSLEQWKRKLIEIRASHPEGHSAEGVIQFATQIIKASDNRHSVSFITPWGEVEIVGADTAALTWVGEQLQKAEF